MKKSSIALFFKGMAMGTVDIVPGVSGSTVAVLLGIYERFITALRNIDAKLIKAIFSPFAHKFSAESRAEARKKAKEADTPWLLTLLAGLATAFVVASFVIPTLMEKFPEIMRGFFFGLVLGSIITPIRTIKKWHISRFAVIAAFAAAFFVFLGLHLTAPAALTETVSNGESLTAICLQTPCFTSPNEVLAMPENEALRAVVSTPDAPIPAGTSLTLPTPYVAYCLLAGFCAICAMLLPGISGSFILLVLGCYYFMLNTGKGFLSGLAHGQFYGRHVLYLGCFVGGALIGIAAFSRALSWLLRKHRELTLAAIIGILLGCLRAVWPYRDALGNNIAPGFSTPMLWPTLLATLCGLAIVVITVVVQSRLSAKDKSDSAENTANPDDAETSVPDTQIHDSNT
ncbi:MAG: DUF368 domain-containing protein [Proteobacteria bacterium]|nr:DUF368 domain-containing protein [Pseudomonadota bacterium]